LEQKFANFLPEYWVGESQKGFNLFKTEKIAKNSSKGCGVAKM
jgi:hypothetical protein